MFVYVVPPSMLDVCYLACVGRNALHIFAYVASSLYCFISWILFGSCEILMDHHIMGECYVYAYHKP